MWYNDDVKRRTAESEVISMGWTAYRATHYNARGRVNRKAECDGYFEEGLNRGHYKVMKSAMKGSVYYGAIKKLVRYVGKGEDGKSIYEPLPETEQKVFGVVFLTSVDSKDYYNFAYKDMDESMGPFYFDCPKSILDLLSPTDDKDALAWREKCRERIAKEKEGCSLSKLPIGSVIRFLRGNGETSIVMELVKHPAAYQFKRPFWYWPEGNSYVSAKHIPDSFEVVKVGT